MNRIIVCVLMWIIAVAVTAQHKYDKINFPDKVIIFMATDCPVTQKYISAIKELDLAYQSRDIKVLGYFPAGISNEEEREFRREYQIQKSILFVDDSKHKATDTYGAKITPEVFLIDKSGSVIYQGAIDNWFFELGRYRPVITEHYLIDAIEASLNGKTPIVKKTEAIGCFIQGTSHDKTHQHPHGQ